MDADERNEGDSAQPVTSPPSEMGDAPPRLSGWPTGIGVLGIIVASLGIVGGCCGVLSPFTTQWFIDSMGANMPEEQVKAMKASQAPATYVIPASLLGTAFAVLLLVGSIKLIRRRASGVRLCQIWAWISIPWSVITFLVTAYFQMQVPDDPNMGPVGKYIGLGMAACFVLVLGIGIPLFMLAWFSRPSIRDEIRSWAELDVPARI
jgi:hypothetical protein